MLRSACDFAGTPRRLPTQGPGPIRNEQLRHTIPCLPIISQNHMNRKISGRAVTLPTKSWTLDALRRPRVSVAPVDPCARHASQPRIPLADTSS